MGEMDGTDKVEGRRRVLMRLRISSNEGMSGERNTCTPTLVGVVSRGT